MVTTTTNIQKWVFCYSKTFYRFFDFFSSIRRKRREEATAAAQSRRHMSREVQRNLRRVGLDAPVESKENAASTSQNITKAVLQRQQELERWRQERAAKRLAEQRQQKPVFKCGKAQDTHRQTMMALPPLKDSNSVRTIIPHVVQCWTKILTKLSFGVTNCKGLLCLVCKLKNAW